MGVFDILLTLIPLKSVWCREKRVFKTLARIMSAIAANQRGTSAVEYGLILAFIVLVMFSALQTLAGVTTDMWSNVSNKVENAH